MVVFPCTGHHCIKADTAERLNHTPDLLETVNWAKKFGILLTGYVNVTLLYVTFCNIQKLAGPKLAGLRLHVLL